MYLVTGSKIVYKEALFAINNEADIVIYVKLVNITAVIGFSILGPRTRRFDNSLKTRNK